jgi:tetratricopeptide (TPR) repeat protein
MTRTIEIGCALAMAGACFAQNQQYRAKLALEGGANLPATPLFTDPAAGQDFPPCRIVNAFTDGLVIYRVQPVIDPGSDPIMRHFEDKCAITILLKGYRKATVTLHDGAVIVLKQIGDPEGSTVSVTALHVPKDAAKAYDKGLEAMSDGKLSGAQKQFERAVALYPAYAQAWSQLGEVLEQQSEPKEAADACEHALKADPKYIRPYLQLIRLAVAGKSMEDAAAFGDRAMQMDPVEFPGIYYYDAVANYELKHADVAERAVRRAIEIDKAHEYPAAEALLGKVLADKGDSHGALDHFTKYVQLAPKADDVPAIRQRMAELERGEAPAK